MLNAWNRLFRAAWILADSQGRNGGRVDAGLEAVMPSALLAYSEWLDDSEGLILGAVDCEDDRSHDDLVAAFLEEINA